ncbi:MAG: GTPase HflX [Anaerolineae bacterium 49_20]|nr:MAG: GTPase HflX [Anaerolineae bacterium 49_20]
MKENYSNLTEKETGILVGVQVGSPTGQSLSLEDSLAELELLAETAGVEVVGTLTQQLATINPRTFIGSGKVEELKLLANELGVQMVIFDDELSPRHQRELERVLGESIKVIDRTALILDIFALHARTYEGMLQVELAQLEYRLPRLTHAWIHLERQAGGGGGRAGGVGGVGLRGPGEKQLELDRREIKARISRIKDELKKVQEQRSQHRAHRRKTNIPVVALVGYTNAGKSTLMNSLTHAGILVADQLFATLDPTTRQLGLPNGQTILLTDTVGFIQKLPTQLIAAFRATLEEITEADLLVHLVDAAHENAIEQKRTVLKTLHDIGAGDLPILTVFNKIDLLDESAREERRQIADPQTIFISAKTGEGFDGLLAAIEKELVSQYTQIRVLLPFEQGQLRSLFHERGKVQHTESTADGIRMSGYLPKELVSFFEPYQVKPEKNK